MEYIWIPLSKHHGMAIFAARRQDNGKLMATCQPPLDLRLRQRGDLRTAVALVFEIVESLEELQFHHKTHLHMRSWLFGQLLSMFS